MNTLTALLPLVWLLAFISPLLAMVCAIIFYDRSRRKWPDRDGRVTGVAYTLILVLSAAVAYAAGVQLGITWACPSTGNLCGLAGFFVVGPVVSSLAILLVAGLLTWRGIAKPGR